MTFQTERIDNFLRFKLNITMIYVSETDDFLHFEPNVPEVSDVSLVEHTDVFSRSKT